MVITIPSRGRAEKINTLNFIPIPWHKKTKIIVPRKERRTYAKAHPNFEVIGCPAEGIAPTRQWILDNIPERYIFFADDDGRFTMREDITKPRLTGIKDNPEAQRKMWAMVKRYLKIEKYALVGISYRSGNNHVTADYKDNTKAFSFWGVNTHVLKREGIRIDRTELMEDFQVILALLTRGYENRVIYRFTWDQQYSNSPGGCSLWRTQELQAEMAHKLHSLYPRYVKVVTKISKSDIKWFGNQTPRTDVRISWKKAYEENKL